MAHVSLQRITGNGRFVPEIDGLRFVAIATVVLFHLFGALKNLGVINTPFLNDLYSISKGGGWGVQLFFMISAYILAQPFLREAEKKVDLKKFYLRRLTRIEPPYLILMAGLGAVHLIVDHHPVETIQHFLASIFYVHTFAYHEMSTLNAVAWSLELEVVFYCLAPFLFRAYFGLKSETRRTVIAILAAALTSATIITIPPDSWLSLTLPYHLHYFLIGLLLADLTAEKEAKSYIWDAAAVAGIVLWAIYGHEKTPLTRTLFPWLLTAVFMGVLRGKAVGSLLSRRFFTDAGGMCYSIYLTHFFVVQAVVRLVVPRLSFLPTTAVVLVASALAVTAVWVTGAVFFLLLEKPFMDPEWVSKLFRRSLPVDPSTTPNDSSTGAAGRIRKVA